MTGRQASHDGEEDATLVRLEEAMRTAFFTSNSPPSGSQDPDTVGLDEFLTEDSTIPGRSKAAAKQHSPQADNLTQEFYNDTLSSDFDATLQTLLNQMQNVHFNDEEKKVLDGILGAIKALHAFASGPEQDPDAISDDQLEKMNTSELASAMASCQDGIREAISFVPQIDIPGMKQFLDQVLDPTLMEQFHSAFEQQYLPDLSSIYDFQYQGLETGTTIRLLTFVNTPSTETNQNYIFVHLEHVDLNQNPVFNALSYVWGDHRPPVNQKYNSKRAEQIFHIICNGRKKRVTYNLFCFLRRLTAALPSGPLWNVKDTRIWIDQLCVNQSDDTEKAAQVSMMNRVYSQARSVVSWLGESDIQTNKAVTVLNSLRSIPQSLITRPDFDVAQFVKNTSNHDWVALGALLSRPYFKRAWIVQEIAMANELIVVCGDFAIPWDDLVHCSRILEESRAWTMLSRFAIVFGPVKDQMSSNRLRSHVRFGGQLSAVLKARDTIKDVSASSETLLLVGRQFDATVTVDKFYAMVGLAQLRLKISGLTNFPTIDYGRSLQEVALDFAKYYLRTSGSLNILSQVEDSANRTPGNQDFPSWLPDPAAPLLPLPLDAGVTHGKASSPWRVRGNAPSKKPPSIDGSSLRVHGQRICGITHCAVPFNILSESDEWFQLFDFMSGLSDVKTGPFKLGEALWRTLITSTDPSSGKGASTVDLDEEFGDWCISLLSSLRNPNTNYEDGWMAETIQMAYRMDDKKFDIMAFGRNSLGVLESSKDSLEDSLPTPELWFDSIEKYNQEKRIKDDVKTAKKLETALIRLSQLAQDDIFPNAERIRVTADKLDPLRVDGPGVKNIRARIDRFKAAIGMKLDSRRLFVTEDGRIGVGPQSLLETDEIWALDGADVPMIIRKGESESFRFIGEAFVFGIMHGESTIEDPSQLVEVVLE